MDKLKNELLKFIRSNFDIIMCAITLVLLILNYSKYNINIFIFIYGIAIVCLLLKRLNKDYKILNIFPQNKLIIIIFIIFLIFMSNQYGDRNFIVRQNNSNGKNISAALLVDPVEKEIKISSGKFDTLAIQFATYKRNNEKATYNISLIKNDKSIFTKDFNASEFKDSEYSKIYVGKQKSSKNDKFKIIIKPIYADSSNCISYYTDKNSSTINYQIIDSSINISKQIIVGIFFIIFFSLTYIVNTKELKPERMYLLLALYFIPITFIIPSYDIPDEPVHFLRSYKLSLITNKNDKVSNVNSTTLYGPSINCLPYGQFQNVNSHFNANRFKKCIKENKNTMQQHHLVNNLSSVNPLSHIIPAIGIKVADTFSNSTLKIFMTGRLMNCLLSIIGVLYAIKKAKKNKLLLLFIATIPMFVQQMISYSYDSLLNTSCIIVTALIINILCKEKLKKKDYIIFSMCLTYIACSKYLYLLLIAPLLFVNKSNIKEYIKEHSYIAYIMIMPIVIFLVWKLFGITAIQVNSSNVQNQSNISYIMSNPLKLATIAFNTIKINGWFYIQGLFGYFGWFIFRFDNYIYIIYILMIIILLKNNKTSENILGKKEKIVSIISVLIMIAGVFASMYFFWSSYKLNYVDGVQGRYFIPLMGLLLLVCIPKKKKDLKIDKNDFYIFANLSLIIYVVTLICNIY